MDFHSVLHHPGVVSARLAASSPASDPPKHSKKRDRASWSAVCEKSSPVSTDSDSRGPLPASKAGYSSSSSPDVSSPSRRSNSCTSCAASPADALLTKKHVGASRAGGPCLTTCPSCSSGCSAAEPGSGSHLRSCSPVQRCQLSCNDSDSVAADQVSTEGPAPSKRARPEALTRIWAIRRGTTPSEHPTFKTLQGKQSLRLPRPAVLSRRAKPSASALSIVAPTTRANCVRPSIHRNDVATGSACVEDIELENCPPPLPTRPKLAPTLATAPPTAKRIWAIPSATSTKPSSSSSATKENSISMTMAWPSILLPRKKALGLPGTKVGFHAKALCCTKPALPVRVLANSSRQRVSGATSAASSRVDLVL